MTLVQLVRVELRDALWLANLFMDDTSIRDMIRTAPAIWEFFRETLENLLITTEERFERCRKEDDEEEEPPPADTVNCRVCFENLPTIVLLSCGHVLCKYCSKRVVKCPFCRKIIVQRKNLFF